MNKRTRVTWMMVVGGFSLQGIAYFFLSAPLGRATDATFSNPRVPFAPLLFIIGVVLVFLAAVVFELMPQQPDDPPGG